MTQDFIRYGTLGGKYAGSPGQIASLFKERNLKQEIDKPLTLKYLNGREEKWPKALDYISYYIELFRQWAYRQTDGDTALLAEIDDYIKDLYSLIKKANNSSELDDVELSRLEALKTSLTEKLGDYIPPRLINVGQDGVNELLQHIKNNLYIDSYPYKPSSKWWNAEIERFSLALEKVKLIEKLIKKVSPESREKYLLLNRLDDLESCFIGWIGAIEKSRDNNEWTIINENIEGYGKEFQTLMSEIEELKDELNAIVKKNKQQSTEKIPDSGKAGVGLIENKTFDPKEDLDALQAIDEWKIIIQPHIEDPGVTDVSPNAYGLTQKIVTWCDTHSSIDAGILWEVYRQIKACRKPEPEGYIGHRKSPEIMKDTYRQAIDVCNRIFELIKSKKNARTNSGGKAMETPVTLREFMSVYCEPLSKSLLESRIKSLQSLHQRTKIKLQHVGKYERGQSKKYLPSFLSSKWPTYRKILPSLPELKQS